VARTISNTISSYSMGKTHKRMVKKKALINNEWDKLHEYAKCLNVTSHKNYKKK
jgi:hypothetical protein